jgi:phosphohistidine phosphatase
MASDQLVPHRLILLRHAKSAWPQGVADLDRPLADRGIADAAAAGTALAELLDGAVADVVLCSPARRTRQTLGLAAKALPDLPEPMFEPVIYGASVPELLELIRAVPDEARTVLVVGHEPTMSATTLALAGPGSQADDLARLKAKYPTGAIAVLRSEQGWSEQGWSEQGWSGQSWSGRSDDHPAGVVLERFLVPRG